MVGKSLAGLGVALVLSFPTPVSAAPLGASPGAKPADAVSPVEQVARRCWRHRGHWHCRRYVRRYYRDYGYAPYYGYGPGYYSYGPGFGLFFGGHRHRHHWHHRHW